MLPAFLVWLGNLLGGPFARAAVDAYRAKLAAENTSEKIAADLPPVNWRLSSASASWRMQWFWRSRAVGTRRFRGPCLPLLSLFTSGRS